MYVCVCMAWHLVAWRSRHVKMNGALSLAVLFRGPRSAWAKCQSLTGEAGWKMSSFTGKSWEPGNVSTLHSTPPWSCAFSLSLILSLYISPSLFRSLLLCHEIKGGRITQQILRRVIERWPGASQAKMERGSGRKRDRALIRRDFATLLLNATPKKLHKTLHFMGA